MNTHRLFAGLFAGLFVLLSSLAAHAQAPDKQTKKSANAKPGVVLLPVQGASLTAVDRDQYRSALANALSEKYQVYSGAEVDKKLQSYAKKTCDAEKCLVEITADYQAALVGRSIISREEDGFTVTVEVVDIYSDNRAEISDTRPCPRCNKAGVIELLKAIAMGRASEKVASEEERERSSWSLTRSQDSIEGYGAFLASFPSGNFAEAARGAFDSHAQKLSPAQKGQLITDWLNKSRQNFLSKQFDNVQRLSRTILMLEPKEQAAMLNLATALFMLRKNTEAESAAQQLLAVNPKQGAVFTLLGALREQAGSPNEALENFKRGCNLKHEVSCTNEKRLLAKTASIR